MKLILIVSHFLGRGQSKREVHKELIHNFVEPCAVYWILFLKLGRRHRSGQIWKCRSRGPSVPTVARQAHLVFLGWRFKNGMFALYFSPNLFWVCLAGYGLVKNWIRRLRGVAGGAVVPCPAFV